MKFVFDGDYREFNGYVFVHGKPAVVTDKATIDALLKDSTMRRVPDEEGKGQTSTEAAAAVLKQPERPVLHAKRGWPLGKPRKVIPTDSAM